MCATHLEAYGGLDNLRHGPVPEALVAIRTVGVIP